MNHTQVDPDRPGFHFAEDHQPNHHHIQRFFHCNRCAEECPKGTKPRDFMKIEAGWTRDGFQLWCVRHESNIIHIDLGGVKIVGDKTDCRDTKHIHEPYSPDRSPICDCVVKRPYEESQEDFEHPVEEANAED